MLLLMALKTCKHDRPTSGVYRLDLVPESRDNSEKFFASFHERQCLIFIIHITVITSTQRGRSDIVCPRYAHVEMMIIKFRMQQWKGKITIR